MMMMMMIIICSYQKDPNQWVFFSVLINFKVWTFVHSQNKTICGNAVLGHSVPSGKAQLFSVANITFSNSLSPVISFPWFEGGGKILFFGKELIKAGLLFAIYSLPVPCDSWILWSFSWIIKVTRPIIDSCFLNAKSESQCCLPDTWKAARLTGKAIPEQNNSTVVV